MSYIGKNIKKIRTVKKLSQAAFAEQFELGRASVGAYEEGRAEPKIETVIHIANHFGISIDALLTKELTVNELYNFDIFKSDFGDLKIKKLVKNLKGSRTGETPLVPSGAFMDYIINHHDRSFVESLPSIKLPVEEKAQYRAFEVEGDQMEYYNTGIHHKDILMAKLIPDNKVSELNEGKVYAIVMTKRVVIKRLAAKSNSELELKPDNPSYKLFSIKMKDVLEIWEVVGVYTRQFRAPLTLEERLLKAEKAIEKLNKKLK